MSSSDQIVNTNYIKVTRDEFEDQLFRPIRKDRRFPVINKRLLEVYLIYLQLNLLEFFN